MIFVFFLLIAIRFGPIAGNGQFVNANFKQLLDNKLNLRPRQMVHYGHPFPIHHFRSDVRLTLSLNYWAFKKIWISHKTFCCFTIRFGRSPGMGRSWISVLAAHQIGYFVHVRRVINLKRNYNEVMK